MGWRPARTTTKRGGKYTDKTHWFLSGLTIVPAEGGGYIAEAALVSVGIKTDWLIEVSVPALTDGVLVIRNAEGIQPGMLVAPRVYGIEVSDKPESDLVTISCSRMGFANS